jgi:PTH1 family peptidyl-tRNA hydrolase
MASIIDRLGSQDFPRLRVGIGRPPGRMEAADYVLEDFSPQDAAFLPEILDRAAEAALAFTVEGLEAAMNSFNGPIDE